MAKPWENASGLPDPTAYAVEKKETAEERRKKELVYILKTIIRWSGFELLDRIKIRGASGKVYD